MKKAIGYIGFVLLSFGFLFIMGMLFEIGHSKDITPDSVEPDILLSNSKNYIEEHAYKRSMQHLSSAIEAIEEIEQGIDPESREKVDKAVIALKKIYDEMSHDNFDIKKLNEASVKALNALTYAELKITEHFVESHELDKAKVALNYGMLHVKNALMFSEGSSKEYEVAIYTEMDSIINSNQFSNKELILRLERMIDEMDEQELQMED